MNSTIHPQIVISDDGSSTLTHPIIGDTYHSTAGAVGESRHVYIKNGLEDVTLNSRHINILEMGFGTGLNFLLSVEYALEHGITIDYATIELYPVDIEVIKKLGYEAFTSREVYDIFIAAHLAPWGSRVKLSRNITILKLNCAIESINYREAKVQNIDIVYFDAFAYDSQPELWSCEVFVAIYKIMVYGGTLVTYSAKGVVKQALRDVGFYVKRLPGALGKHHQVRATKLGD